MKNFKTIFRLLFPLYLFLLGRATYALDNPLKGITGNDINVNTIIGNVIHNILGIVGSLALAMFIYGGFLWMLSGGNNEQIQKGKNVLLYATIGLIVIFSAYGVINFVINGLMGK